MKLATIFSAPKPFTDPHVALIQENAIRSWIALGETVEVVLVGEEPGLAEMAERTGARHLPVVRRSGYGTPLLSEIFQRVSQSSSTPLSLFVNADILFLPDLAAVFRELRDLRGRFLVVGRRWDLDIRTKIAFSPGWEEALRQDLAADGRLHPPHGSDYFLFRRGDLDGMPDFALGRSGWDNWTIFFARRQGWKVIDGTEAVTAVHQQHDYSHLPGGRIHYRLPESADNLRLAGGSRHIFNLVDANWRLDRRGTLHRPRLTLAKVRREIEIWPVIRWDVPFWNNLGFAVMNPAKYLRQRFPGRSTGK